jgi:hypothetical protein
LDVKIELGKEKTSSTGQSPSNEDIDWKQLSTFELAGEGKIFDPVHGPIGEWHGGTVTMDLPRDFEDIQLWSPDEPIRQALRITVATDRTSDQVTTWFGTREFGVGGGKWFLNAHEINLRGVLNWGYAPPLTSPSLDEAWMRNEIETAKSNGFNLMKFCLWVPPKRYLELCDELGMLAWIEYPTWHPQLTGEHLTKLRKEYAEFFAYDRNHPSVILRSLTCETGSGAELDVIQSLYDLCKIHVPGAIVEDDSSWIEWNRVSDFFDDHPYGNNHTWPGTLHRLKTYAEEHGDKPLILGEAIAADTWASPRRFADWSKAAAPHHRPGFLADNVRWLQQTGLNDDELTESSRRYAMLMRKYQIESYRRLVPDGGYVVSVIRDFPLAGMGLLDYAAAPKWSAEDWSFHGETMLLLETEQDRRSYFEGETLKTKLWISHCHLRQILEGRLEVRLVLPARDGEICLDAKTFDRTFVESDQSPVDYEVNLESMHVTQPVRLELIASFQTSQRIFVNKWPIWIFPRQENRPTLRQHPSIQDATSLKETFAVCGWNADRRGSMVLCAARLDQELLEHVAGGGRLLLLPNGQAGSFPLDDHWFLRGGPAVFPLAKELFATSMGNTIDDMFTELQHFDLAGPVVPNLDSMFDKINPIFMLWDNHDRKETRTHGLMFEIPVGRGRILVSTLDWKRSTNAAGQWILAAAARDLLADPGRAADERGEANLARLRAELSRDELELQSRDWRFQPDPKIEGEKNGWQSVDFDDGQWPTIKADRHWEGQGHESLDGWAWYRLRVPLDGKWSKADKVYLNFTGVDDHYRLFVNGKLVGTGGDAAAKKTAFDERKSHDITAAVRGKTEVQIAIAVFDWYGAGGIFRPVTLSTQPLRDDRPWLK